MSCKVSFGVNVTVSILNIFYLPEILEKLENFFPASALHLTTVHEPKFYSVVNIQQDCKKIIEKKLTASRYQEKLMGISTYMMSQEYNPALWKKFVVWTEKKDKYRKVDIQQYLPEYYEIIGPEYKAALGDFQPVV
ncbi:MAG: hypothetical protein ABL930_13640 [Pseudobdellovibrio sp.]